jgi:uncharacterized membrane protein
MSNLALADQSPRLATLATALLVLLTSLAIRSRLWRCAFLIVSIAALAMAANSESPPLWPMMLPPVVVPATLAWLFGHTLLGDREALVVRFARAVHSPEPLDNDHAAYARSVTVMWTLVLTLFAAINFLLVTLLVPGGILDQIGIPPWWPVGMSTFLWSINAVYLLIPIILVAEFLYRLRRFPGYRLSNPLELARAGHFPGMPLVPGVVLLEWTLREAASALALEPRRLRIRECKFFRPLEPQERADLFLDIQAPRCGFKIRRDGDLLASGVLEVS